MEAFFTGYCRNTDESRMVCVEKENGQLLEADCQYACCPYTGECTIAKSIREFLEQK